MAWPFTKDEGSMTQEQYNYQQSVRPETLDPLAAAQIGRNWGDENQFFGIANLTIENKKVIEEFRARLRGYETQKSVDAHGNELPIKRIKFGEPIMNESGINHLCGLLENALNKTIMLSNFPKEMQRRTEQFCKVWGRTVIAQIAFNSENWQVDRSRRDSLPIEMYMLLYSSLMRAYDDGERKKLYPGQKGITTTLINPAYPGVENKKVFNW